MAYVLVGLAVVFFAYLFLLGGLNSDERKRCAVILVLFVFAAAFWAAFEQAPDVAEPLRQRFHGSHVLRLRGAGALVPVDQLGLHHPARARLRGNVGGARPPRHRPVQPDQVRHRPRAGRSRLPDHGAGREYRAGQRRHREGLGVVADDQLSAPDAWRARAQSRSDSPR